MESNSKEYLSKHLERNTGEIKSSRSNDIRLKIKLATDKEGPEE